MESMLCDVHEVIILSLTENDPSGVPNSQNSACLTAKPMKATLGYSPGEILSGSVKYVKRSEVGCP